MVNQCQREGYRKSMPDVANVSGALLMAFLASALSTAAAATIGSSPEAALYEKADFLASRGQEAASANILETLVTAAPSDLSRRARVLLMLDERTLFHYRSALDAITPLLGSADTELANHARLLRALVNIPPEIAERRSPVLLQSEAITASVGSEKLHFLVDTGSSFSVLSQSAARIAGLRICPIHYEIASATGQQLYADLAVGDLTIGVTRVRNVVFLVLPDTAMRHAVPYSGVIGMPVLRVLGPLILGREMVASAQHKAPLIFVGGAPNVGIVAQGASMICALDTGSNRSWFAASSGVLGRELPDMRRPAVIQSAAGSDRNISTIEMPLRFTLAGRSAVIHRALEIEPRKPGPDRASCTLGEDAIAALEPVLLDFGQMGIFLQ